MASDFTLRLNGPTKKLFQSITKFCHRKRLRPPRTNFLLIEASDEIQNNCVIITAIVGCADLHRDFRESARTTLEALNQNIERYVAFSRTDIAQFGNPNAVRNAAAGEGIGLRSVVSPFEDFARKVIYG